MSVPNRAKDRRKLELLLARGLMIDAMSWPTLQPITGSWAISMANTEPTGFPARQQSPLRSVGHPRSSDENMAPAPPKAHFGATTQVQIPDRIWLIPDSKR